MDIKIEGNPGTGNTFQEIKIGKVENYNPAATMVINHYYDSHVKPQDESKASVNKEYVRQEILQYVEKTRQYVAFAWQNQYMALWVDILELPEVQAVVYTPGQKSDKCFNHKEVAHILCYLGKYANGGIGIFRTFVASHIAACFGDGKANTIRPELGFRPSKEIQHAIDNLLKSKNYKTEEPA